MKHLNAIIIDDELNALRLLQLSLQELFPDIRVEKTCSVWAEALQALKQNRYDLIFIDIMMPGKSGIELVRMLPGLSGKIIFVTAHQQYALEAFRCYAFGYLLKPVDEAELHAVVSRAVADLQAAALPARHAATGGMLGIPGSRGIDYIMLEHILYLRSDNKCTKVVLKDKTLVSSYHIGKFHDFLASGEFFQVHRSYIVNLRAVKRYVHNESSLVMTDNTEIPVARSARESLLKQFATLSRLP